MRVCPSCGVQGSDTARFCAACGRAHGTGDEPTILHDAPTIPHLPDVSATRSAPRSPVSFHSPGTGLWSSSSGGAHGRFEPGTLLAGRYRIVARIGQGGMGEVYRADDLKLGQPVAMKFLPETVEADPVRLAQFHTEVRLARQVAHKNVCRMYDVGDVDGLPFLTMEYVDGEDLASLLRRIGRLPEDKALDLARQLCAGLAAAHEQGVLHRDLKPANVMIDGEGQVRITDFGLAAIAGTVRNPLAGTPAYMAPELLAGREPSVQSDVYALGLVLYELFTGRRAFVAHNLAELLRLQNETTITPPTALVKDLDPAIERTVLRTLNSDPAQRPRSALAVAGSLPGGDPLAAALAAGETPSPEMVAAAGERSGVTNEYAIGAAVAVVLLLAIAAGVSPQRRTLSRAAPDKPPDVLIDRAQQVLDNLGYGTRGDASRWEFTLDTDLLRYARTQHDLLTTGDPVTGRPGALLFYRRTSPRALLPRNPLAAVSLEDPPLDLSGMTTVVLDRTGRLVSFEAVPPQKDESPQTGQPPDWAALFRMAALDPAAFHAVPPLWLPRGLADARQAWEGPMPDGPPHVRVEAAGWRGRPIYFQIVTPWTRPLRMEENPSSRGARILNAVTVLATLILLVCALLVSRANVRAGRGDWKGASRLGTVAVIGQLLAWAFNDPHAGAPSEELARFFASIGESLFAGSLLFVMHLAVEPAVRRYWPHGVLGWSRLLQGRFRDARVGRDVLVGLATGAGVHLIISARQTLQWAVGDHNPPVFFGAVRYFEGPRYVIGFLASILAFQAVYTAMWCIFTIVGLRRMLRSKWIVAIGAVLVFALLAGRDVFIDAPGVLWLNVCIALVVAAVIAALAVRMGLLATAACFVASFALGATPWTFDLSAWYFPPAALAFAILAALAGFAGYAARTGTVPPVRLPDRT
ncbi:MAG: eukaryotic-like serine/threonine-protein kinase [Acidobacteriota bacterium]|jgi:serine/threonine-protein kinase